MKFFKKAIVVFALAITGIQSAQAQEMNMNPETLTEAEARRIVFVNAGFATAPKFVVQRFDFRPRFFNEIVYAVRVVGTDETVDIRRATVTLRNGQVFNLNNLEGFLREGRAKQQFIGGRRIRKVSIWATSPNPIGSRGDFRVDFAVWR